jgi:hypothetical protein
MRHGVSVKAIALGVAVCIGGSLVFSLAASIALGIAAGGRPSARVVAETVTRFLWVNLLVGLALTFFGGLVAGRMAADREALHGAVVGLIALALNLAFAGGEPVWFKAVSWTLLVPLAILGGLAAKRRKARGRLPSPPDEPDAVSAD